MNERGLMAQVTTEQGWDTVDVVRVLLGYIEKQGSPEAFAGYLKAVVEAERSDAEVEADLAHAYQQGLRPVMTALDEIHADYAIEQTGGNTMAVVVTIAPPRTTTTGKLAIMRDSGDPAAPYVAAFHLGDSWQNPDSDLPPMLVEALTLPQVLALVRELGGTA